MAKFKITLAPKHLQHTFIEIRKKQDWLCVNQSYDLIQNDKSETFVKRTTLVDITYVSRQDLTTQLAYLDKHCNLKIYQEIMDYYNYQENELLSVLTFSNTSPIC